MKIILLFGLCVHIEFEIYLRLDNIYSFFSASCLKFHFSKNFYQTLPPDFYCSTSLPPVNDRATVIFTGLCLNGTVFKLIVALAFLICLSDFPWFARLDAFGMMLWWHNLQKAFSVPSVACFIHTYFSSHDFIYRLPLSYEHFHLGILNYSKSCNNVEHR